MKRSLLAIFLFLPFATGWAQNGNEARAILDKTYSAFNASEGIRLSFTLSSLDQNDKLFDTQEGEASIKGDKFHLEMEAMDVWFDGKTQWVLIKEVNEVNISQPTTQEIASISPLALLALYKNGYTLEATQQATLNGKSVHRIKMNPTASNKDFQSVIATIDKTSNTLLQVLLAFPNGVKNQIDIPKYNANYHYPESEFTFNAANHPGVEIVDLR